MTGVFRTLLAVAAVLSWGLSVPVLAQQGPPGPSKGQGTASHAGHEEGHRDDRARELPPFIPPLTDEDRKAAFPDVEGHATHDRNVHYLVLFDQLEAQLNDGVSSFNVDGRSWIGGDRDRVWLRTEGSSQGATVEEAQVHVLYGHQVARWWDLVAGIRQDFRPGSPQTWAAVGVQGLAPYWFDIEATAYVGPSGRIRARFAVEYELLITNRLIVQPLVEAEIVGRGEPERGVGAGLSTSDAGFRLRYEIRRELAPYVGVTWSRKWGRTGQLAEAAGEKTGGGWFVTGLRLWF